LTFASAEEACSSFKYCSHIIEQCVAVKRFSQKFDYSCSEGLQSQPVVTLIRSSVESVSNGRSNGRGFAERRFEQTIGNSPALESVLAAVEQGVPIDSTTLVLGESGTGMELIARAIHKIRPRCGRPFIKLNCAAIPFAL
jgi:transcriptional regulator with PAS, ATPase and Fis domain